MRRVPEVVRRVILKTGFGWIVLVWVSVAWFRLALRKSRESRN